MKGIKEKALSSWKKCKQIDNIVNSIGWLKIHMEDAHEIDDQIDVDEHNVDVMNMYKET